MFFAGSPQICVWPRFSTVLTAAITEKNIADLCYVYPKDYILFNAKPLYKLLHGNFAEILTAQNEISDGFGLKVSGTTWNILITKAS